jgi:hypothetical protein
MNCALFRYIGVSYVDETLDEDRRKWFRDHLRECGSCREAAFKQEPSLIFAAANLRPAAPESVEACVTAVTARIRQDRFERRFHHRRRPWLAAAAGAVLVVSGGLVWRTLVGDESSAGSTVETVQDLEAHVPPPSVEVEMTGDDVRVYQFATDGEEDTAVYFIVDPALEL